MSLNATATVTVTGVAGPGIALTAKVFNNIALYQFDVVKNVFTMTTTDNKVIRVAIDSATTVTVVLSAAGGNHTVTIS